MDGIFYSDPESFDVFCRLRASNKIEIIFYIFTQISSSSFLFMLYISVILALSVKFAKRIKQHSLIFCLQNHQIHVNFLAVEQLDENTVVVLLCDSIGVATGGLDECFQRSIEEFVDFSVIVIIVTDSCGVRDKRIET